MTEMPLTFELPKKTLSYLKKVLLQFSQFSPLELFLIVLFLLDALNKC